MNYLVGGATLVNFPVIWVVARFLGVAGPTPFSELKGALRPPTVVPPGASESNAFTASLGVAEHLQLLQVAGEDTDEATWSLGPRLEGEVGGEGLEFSDADRFGELCRKAFFKSEIEAIGTEEKPSDVAVGLAWLTSRDPREPLATVFENGPNEELRNSNLLEHTAARREQWVAFRRWAIDHGFATELGDRLHPDVVPATTWAVREMAGGRVPANEFVKRIVAAIPVLDGGLIARYVEEQLGAPRGLGDAVAGPLLYHTILRLEAEKMVELHRGDDADGTVAFAVHGTRVPIDGVTVLESSNAS